MIKMTKLTSAEKDLITQNKRLKSRLTKLKTKINNIGFSLKIELKNVKKVVTTKHGSLGYSYEFDTYMNGRKYRDTKREFAVNIKDLKRYIILDILDDSY